MRGWLASNRSPEAAIPPRALRPPSPVMTEAGFHRPPYPRNNRSTRFARRHSPHGNALVSGQVLITGEAIPNSATRALILRARSLLS